jgi:nitrogen-specific signal transduction histidine kinase
MKNSNLMRKSEILIPDEENFRRVYKMETIGNLASGIAHDFNNILNVIIGFTEIALEGVKDPQKVESNLRQVLKASNKARELVQRILYFCRKRQEKKQQLKVTEIVNEVVELISATIPPHIKLRRDISEMEHRIWADPIHIYQVLMNLSVNAVHAMHGKSGELIIQLTDFNKDLGFEALDCFSPSPYIRLTVSDTGCGVKAEVKRDIFEPFFTTKKEGEGTGMGLSVVQGIVKELDGEISVESKRDKGTSFHLFIPVIHNLESTEGENKQVGSRQKGTILLIDKDVVSIMDSKKLLDKFGYRVIPRTDTIEALAKFRAQPGLYDLILVNQEMPDMSGIEMAVELLKIRPKIPVILCAGISEDLKWEHIKGTGVRGLLLKPITSDKLSKLMQKIPH